MTISMMEHANGMVLPKCSICGKDVFSKDVASMHHMRVQPNSRLEVMPHGLDCNLIGDGLRQGDYTCSSCLHQSNNQTVP